MKKALRLFALLSVIVFSLVSCQDDLFVPAEQTPTIRGSVSIPEGTSLTGSDFFIRIMEGETAVFTGRVNEDGSFAVSGLSEEASYSILLTTEEPGDINTSEKDISKAPSTSGYGGWLSNVTASVNEQAQVGSVKVKPLGTIKGVVTKDGAEDGYDTTVYIPGTSYLAMTDGQGNFSIFNVPQATYTLRYISNGYMPKMVSNVVLYSASETENPVTTVAEQTLIRNVGILMGNITKAGSTDHSNITVRLSDGKNAYTESTAIDGTLLMTEIEPSTYTATISSNGFITQTVNNIKIEAAKSTTINPVSLIANGGDIKGSVSMNDNGDRAGVIINASSSDGKYSYTTTTDNQGQYQISYAYPGTYTLTLSKTNYAILTKSNVNVLAGQSTQVGNLSFSSDYGTVTGMVTDTNGDGIENAMVKIGDISVFTGEDGSFTKTNIAKGSYPVSVSADGRTSQSLSQSITVESAKTTDIGTVQLGSIYGSLSGAVTVNDNGSVCGIKVTVTAANGNSVQTRTLSDGSYEVAGLVPGEYTISAESANYAVATKSAIVSADSNTEVDVLPLESFYGTIKVNVSYDDSNEKGGIIVTLYDSADQKLYETTTIDNLTVYFRGVEVGNGYRVQTEALGYGTRAKADVIVRSAQETEVTMPALSVNIGQVSGKVEDSKGNPIANAIVRIGEISVFTGADGRFSKSAIAAGNYTIRVSKDGYEEKTLSDKISIGSVSETDIGTIKLSSIYGSLIGNICVNDDRSIEGILITATSATGNIYQARTLADGSYSISSMLCDTYSVTAEADGYSVGARMVVITSDEESIVDVLTLTNRFGTIRGKVEDLNGNPIENAIVKIGEISVFTGSVGSFSKTGIGVGTYSITIGKEGYGSRTLEQTISVESNQTIDLGTIRLTSIFGSVSGEVSLSESADNSGVTVTLTFASNPTIAMTTVSGADGTYTFNNLTNAGQYSLTFSKDGYISDTGTVVTVVLGQNKRIEDITLRSLASKVNGSVILEGTSDHTGINILLKATDNSVQYDATTDQQGSYVLARVNPGEYTLIVSKAGYVSKTVQSIIIESSTEKTLDSLSLAVGVRSITGSVSLELATDHSGALVTATNLSEPTLIYSAITNSEGNYTLAGMIPGEYQIVISRTNYNTVTLPTISVVDSRTLDLGISEVSIARGTILGTVFLEGRSSNAGILAELMKGADVYASTYTDDSGLYVFSVPQGNYSGVRLSCESFRSVSIAQSIALIANDFVTVGENAGRTEMIATHVPVVRGRITVNGLLSLDYSGIRVTLVENDMTTLTDNDGYWSLANVPIGTYTLKIERENTNPITKTIFVVAAADKLIETIELIPNAASIEGYVTLKGNYDYSGITIRAIANGMAELSTKTNAAGYFYLGNVVTTENYTVFFEKDGWVSQNRIVGGFADLSVNNITADNPVELVDTTAPELEAISVIVGNTEQRGRKLSVFFNASDAGSGLRKVFVNTSNDFTSIEPQYYTNPLTYYVEDIEGDYMLYVKVLDAVGNESEIRSNQFNIANYKTTVFSVLIDNEDGTNDGIITWTKAKSPYYVTGNVLVDENTTLIIEPGVNIQFAGPYYLRIEGRLEVNGSQEDNVYFYGVGAGEDKWTGINGINDCASEMHYSVITGMVGGIVGYIRIEDSVLIAGNDGFSLGYGNGSPFSGVIERSSIKGKIYTDNASLINNSVESTNASSYSWFFDYNSAIWSSFLEGNQFSGQGFLLYSSLGENNRFESTKVCIESTGMKNATFESATLKMSAGMYLNCIFDSCTFDVFQPTSVRKSNIIDCGTITITSSTSQYERVDLTSNYWGVNNTAEINSKGTNSNLSFLVDYYDDFSVTKLDINDYVSCAYSDIGYLGDEYYPSIIESERVYDIGEIGPAGGVIFYDKGYYSEGWRYLEVAPYDLEDGSSSIPFGYYRPSDNSDYLPIGTALVVGSGKTNTKMIIETMGDDAYIHIDNDGKTTSSYAAKLCEDYVLNGYDDWFLPSKEELNLIYYNLHLKGIGGFDSYYYWWSSSEASTIGNGEIWHMVTREDFHEGYYPCYGGYQKVRPVRSF